jgi:SAM-dependent methyltransferase
MQLPTLLGRTFRARLHAWWEGYEFTPPEADADGEADIHGDAEGERVAKAKKVEKPAAKEFWSRERIDVAQMLWGPEFVSPLGAEAIAELSAPLALVKGMSVAHVGCGLGGGLRALVRAHGVKATGFEPSAALAKAGLDLSNAAKLKAEAPIGPVDLANTPMKPAAFDRALIEHVLFTLDDKESALKRIIQALKPEAKVLILDLVMQGKAPGPAVAAWGKADPSPVKPWTVDTARKALAKLNVDVGEVADMSDTLGAAIVHGLDEFSKRAETRAVKRTVTAALKREVDLWLARKAALDAGEIKAVAIHGAVAR